MNTPKWVLWVVVAVVAGALVAAWLLFTSGPHTHHSVSTPLATLTAVPDKPDPPTPTLAPTGNGGGGGLSASGDGTCADNACVRTFAPVPEWTVGLGPRALAAAKAYVTLDTNSKRAWAAGYAGLTGGAVLPWPSVARQDTPYGSIHAVVSLDHTALFVPTPGTTLSNGNYTWEVDGRIHAAYTDGTGVTNNWQLNTTWTVEFSAAGDHHVVAITTDAPSLNKAFPSGG